MKKITACFLALSIFLIGCTTLPSMGRKGAFDLPAQKSREEVEIGKRNEGYIQEKIITLDPDQPMKWPPNTEITIPINDRALAELGAYLMFKEAMKALADIIFPQLVHWNY